MVLTFGVPNGLSFPFSPAGSGSRLLHSAVTFVVVEVISNSEVLLRSFPRGFLESPNQSGVLLTFGPDINFLLLSPVLASV